MKPTAAQKRKAKLEATVLALNKPELNAKIFAYEEYLNSYVRKYWGGKEASEKLPPKPKTFSEYLEGLT